MSKTSSHILVVEDDPDIGTMIRIMLEFHGFSVTVTQKADKAMELIKTSPFDLLIMDMLLSGTNGMDICIWLKKDPALSHIPVIMISAHPNAKEISQNAGAEDFLSKPFDMQDMIAKVKRLVEKK